MDKLVGAELIWIVLMGGITVLRLDAFPEISTPGTFLGRANSVAPVIAVGKASAREPDDRRLDFTHLFVEVPTDSVDLRNRGVLPDPDSVVNHPTQILDEMAIDVGRDHT